jgi:hypothetical protein
MPWAPDYRATRFFRLANAWVVRAGLDIMAVTAVLQLVRRSAGAKQRAVGGAGASALALVFGLYVSFTLGHASILGMAQ